MKIIDSLQPEDRVYDLYITDSVNDPVYDFALMADCKHKDHINDHGKKFHYDRTMALCNNTKILFEFKTVLEKFYKS